MADSMTNAQKWIYRYLQKEFEPGSVKMHPEGEESVVVTDRNGKRNTFTINLFGDIMEAGTEVKIAESNIPHSLDEMYKNPTAEPTEWKNVPGCWERIEEKRANAHGKPGWERIKDVRKAGFRPTNRMIDNIEKLDRLSGKENKLKDICKAYRNGCTGLSGEERELVQAIAEECRAQELVRMAPVQ